MKRLTVAALVFALASPVLADKPQKPGKSKDKGKGQSQSSAQTTVIVQFGDHDREVVRTYYTQKYGRGNCPPGLAKKNNGCLPPGQAKKRYFIGQPLPREVVYLEPPHDLVVRLSPVPSGYKYVVVDGDLVKLALGSLLVVDAIDGLFN
jgi:hypothetical protein